MGFGSYCQLRSYCNLSLEYQSLRRMIDHEKVISRSETQARQYARRSSRTVCWLICPKRRSAEGLLRDTRSLSFHRLCDHPSVSSQCLEMRMHQTGSSFFRIHGKTKGRQGGLNLRGLLFPNPRGKANCCGSELWSREAAKRPYRNTSGQNTSQHYFEYSKTSVRLCFNQDF